MHALFLFRSPPHPFCLYTIIKESLLSRPRYRPFLFRSLFLNPFILWVFFLSFFLTYFILSFFGLSKYLGHFFLYTWLFLSLDLVRNLGILRTYFTLSFYVEMSFYLSTSLLPNLHVGICIKFSSHQSHTSLPTLRTQAFACKTTSMFIPYYSPIYSTTFSTSDSFPSKNKK